MESFMASIDVLQMVERKKPKLIPARPASLKIMLIKIIRVKVKHLGKV